MKLILGLGNPGIRYARSRHNIGFTVLKALAKRYKAVFKKDSGTNCLSAKLRIEKQDVILALPFTFMNLSGLAAQQLVNKYNFDPDHLLVVCDDLDLDFGRMKIKPHGSSGGHRGLESIINSLGNKGFNRLRIGIGRPLPLGAQSKRRDWRHPFWVADAADYVLSGFSRKEKKELGAIIDTAVDYCLNWVDCGAAKTMNIVNARSR